MNRIDSRVDKVSFLTQKEILNPFSVLEEVFGDYATCEQVQDDLWDLVTIAFRRNYWTNYDSPKELYEKCLRLCRLIDAGFLISKIRPHYFDEHKMREQHDFVVPNKGNSNLDQCDERLVAYDNLKNFLIKNRLGSIRFDLSYFLYFGFEPVRFRYTDRIGDSGYRLSKGFAEVISNLFAIYRSEGKLKITDRDKIRLQVFENQGIDLERPQFLYEEGYFDEDLEEPVVFQLDVVVDYLNNLSVRSHRDISKYNPGNVLHYFNELLFLLESFWRYYTSLKVKWRERHWSLPEESIREIKYLSKDCLENPLRYLIGKFEVKSLVQWRAHLEEWKVKVLGGEFFNADRYQEASELLLCISELASIMEYEPKRVHDHTKYLG